MTMFKLHSLPESFVQKVEFSVPGAEEKFSIKIKYRRLSQVEYDDLVGRYNQGIIDARVSGKKNEFTDREFCKAVIVGWGVVFDEFDQPKEFSPEALDVLLNIQGMADLLVAQFIIGNQVSRQKN